MRNGQTILVQFPVFPLDAFPYLFFIFHVYRYSLPSGLHTYIAQI